jgi:hypothetical protein
MAGLKLDLRTRSLTPEEHRRHWQALPLAKQYAIKWLVYIGAKKLRQLTSSSSPD